MRVPDASPRRRSLSSERARELTHIAWQNMSATERRERVLKMRIAGGEQARRELDSLQAAAAGEASTP